MQCCVALAAVGQALLWWRALAWYPQLPERFPVHFSAGGAPDRWTDRGAEWFLLPGVSLGLTALLAGVGRFVGRMAVRTPTIVNMPNKELFVRLSPAGRMRVVAPTRLFMAWTAATVTFLFAFILEGTGRVAAKEADALPLWPMLAFMGLVFVGLIAFLLVTTRLVDQVAREEGVLRR